MNGTISYHPSGGHAGCPWAVVRDGERRWFYSYGRAVLWSIGALP